ncbi:MAG TPA: phage tail tape measure protein [Shinella sp.]|jgi:TP901 family phage tail tape measure protein|uniref:phage tail tape measure protein n=1 Tax=Shinella sp. TaxID=1870904 RepID=UPI002E13A324|nr:phage tail tape measure protein [Shinella sp.]
MGSLSASLVVSLTDRTAAGARSVKKSLSDIQRAERDLALARNNRRLTRVDRAEEALQLARDREAHRLEMERERALEQRQRRMGVFFGGVTLAATAAGYAAARSYSKFAEVERQVGRTALNADQSADIVGPTMTKLQQIAHHTALSFEDVANGLDTLVASGRSLDDSMAFLPAVAMTAQASGAAIADIALSADALAGSMKINAGEMQKAFDILVAGGKAGKFELKDMSQYLPSLLPAFSALGYQGTEGLQKVVAMLQVMRNQAGSSSEAATYLSNVLNKMYSADTAKKFKNFGINLPKALDKAKKEGKDLFEVFLDLTSLATKGDLSKLPLLFTDAEMQKGMRALITQRDTFRELTQSLGKVDGTALKDFNQIANDSAAKIQKLSTLWDTFMSQLGGEVADVANPVLEKVTGAITDAQARAKSRREQGELRDNNKEEFARRHRRLDPEKYDLDKNPFAKALLDELFREAETQQGKGQWKTVFDQVDDQLRTKTARQQYLDQTAKASTGRQNRSTLGAKTNHGAAVDEDGNYTTDVPVPGTRPTAESDAAERRRNAYRYGTGRQFVNDEAVKKSRDWSRENWQNLSREERRKRLREADPRQLGMDGMFGVEMEEQQRKQRTIGVGKPGILDDLDGSAPVGASAGGPREVTLMGTPTVISQPSGTQQVQVMNPTPVLAPITVSVSVTATSNADPAAIGQQVGNAVGQKIKAELAGIQADTGWEVA